MLPQENSKKSFDLNIHSAPSQFTATRPNLRAHVWLRSVMVTSVILLVMASLFVSSRDAAAQQTATLRCRIENSTLSADSSTTFFIEIDDVSELYGYELTLNFDGARVHFEDADPNKSGVNFQLGNFLSPDFVVINTVDNSTGQAVLALTQLSPSQAVSGSGELARAPLIGIAPGTANFGFADVILSDPQGVAIPVTLQGCSVDVTAVEATPSPSPSPDPSPSPTPTPDSSPTPTLPDGDASVVVEPGAEATLIYTGTNGLPITIKVPAGAVTETLTLVYTELTIPSTGPLNLLFAGTHFRLEVFRNNVKLDSYVFQIPIQIELRYTNDEVSGLDEASILLYYFDKKQAKWSTDDIPVLDRDLPGNRLRVSVAHLTEFATFTDPLSTADVGSISGIVFEDLNRNGIHDPGEPGVRALLKLYLLDSERIWSVSNKSDGTYLSQQLPDGEYFIEITPLISVAYSFTTPATATVEVADGAGFTNVNFGLDLGTPLMIFLPTIAKFQSVAGAGTLSTSILEVSHD